MILVDSEVLLTYKYSFTSCFLRVASTTLSLDTAATSLFLQLVSNPESSDCTLNIPMSLYLDLRETWQP